MKYSDIFVPGGFPWHTYNPRLELQLEERLNEARNNLCKLVTVTGHTKSGKTVLTRKVFPREDCVWIDGGTVSEENDFWGAVLEQLDLFQNTSKQTQVGSQSMIGGKASAEADFVLVSGEGELSASRTETAADVAQQSRSVSPRVTALHGLRAPGRPLIIDDFHYLPKDLQGAIVRALKPRRRSSPGAKTSTERVRAFRERRRVGGSRLVSLYLPEASISHMHELARRYKWPLRIVVASCITDVWKRVTGNATGRGPA